MIRFASAIFICCLLQQPSSALLTTKSANSLLQPSLRDGASLTLQAASLPPSSSEDRLVDPSRDDQIRDALEELLSQTPERSGGHLHYGDSSTSSSPNIHVLTSHSERIKEMELHLIECLENSDEAVDTLVDLWVREREDASQILRQMETNCSDGLRVEEQILRSLIERYQDEWVEPMSRLAVLLFTKGLYEEATRWCHAVLHAKPWHFETGQLLVACHLRENEYGLAIQAAREHTLPELNESTNNKRRRSWVQKNKARIQQWLQMAREASEDAVHDSVDDECPVDEVCWG